MSEAQNERWLTYVELGALLRCTRSAARMHARRHGWVRRPSNMIGVLTRVLVPSHAAVQRRTDQRTFAAQMFDATNGQDQANSAAVAVLREQLAIANRRIDELTEERRRLLALVTDLADARAAAQINRWSARGIATLQAPAPSWATDGRQSRSRKAWAARIDYGLRWSPPSGRLRSPGTSAGSRRERVLRAGSST